jgi:hypothetical protein
MSTINHPDKVFESQVNTAEMNRQVSVQAAIAAGGSSATIQKNVAAAEATFLRSVIQSCVARGIEAAVYRQALYDVSGSRT